MMIKVLAENTAISENYKSEHGLSLFIKTNNHNILFDMGESELFIENAQKMDVDLTKVDLAFVSHGHYDHGGGLKKFLEINKIAKVYVHKKAFDGYYAKRPSGELKYIGLDKVNSQRIIFTDEYCKINDELELFSNVKQKRLSPHFNKMLYMQEKGKMALDTFEHEQNLIITAETKTALIAGCAHNGIVNIMDRYYEIKGSVPDFVVGGFHLFNHSSGESEEKNRIEEIAALINNGRTKYYTGHCTGVYAYSALKEILRSGIENLSSGKVIEL